MKDSDWDDVIGTNLSAVFRLSRGVLRGMMKARSGRIVNITSVVGSAGNAGQANYAAAKAGVAGMTRALAKEVGSRGITVNCVAPGFIDTDMTKALTPAQIEALTAQIPLARLGSPRRHRRRRRVPGVACGGLHHGHDVARERRDVHGLIQALADRPRTAPAPQARGVGLLQSRRLDSAETRRDIAKREPTTASTAWHRQHAAIRKAIEVAHNQQ